MKPRVLKMCAGWLGAAAIAIPVVALADDQAAESERLRIESRTESRTAVGAASAQRQQTVEGRLVDLHQFMTGASASAAAGKAHQMWAIDSPTGLVLLSDPHVRPAAAAASERGARVIEREQETARATSRTEVEAGEERSVESRQSFESRETAVFGIERRDLDAAQNRVKATGTLYNKSGVKYLVVSTMAPANARGADIERDRPGVRGKIDQKIEREEDIDVEVDVEEERDN